MLLCRDEVLRASSLARAKERPTLAPFSLLLPPRSDKLTSSLPRLAHECRLAPLRLNTALVQPNNALVAAPRSPPQALLPSRRTLLNFSSATASFSSRSVFDLRRKPYSLCPRRCCYGLLNRAPGLLPSRCFVRAVLDREARRGRCHSEGSEYEEDSQKAVFVRTGASWDPYVGGGPAEARQQHLGPGVKKGPHALNASDLTSLPITGPMQSFIPVPAQPDEEFYPAHPNVDFEPAYPMRQAEALAGGFQAPLSPFGTLHSRYHRQSPPDPQGEAVRRRRPSPRSSSRLRNHRPLLPSRVRLRDFACSVQHEPPEPGRPHLGPPGGPVRASDCHPNRHSPGLALPNGAYNPTFPRQNTTALLTWDLGCGSSPRRAGRPFISRADLLLPSRLSTPPSGSLSSRSGGEPCPDMGCGWERPTRCFRGRPT